MGRMRARIASVVFVLGPAQNVNLYRLSSFTLSDVLYSVPPAFPVSSGTVSVSCVLASSICQLFHCAS